MTEIKRGSKVRVTFVATVSEVTEHGYKISSPHYYGGGYFSNTDPYSRDGSTVVLAAYEPDTKYLPLSLMTT